MSLLGRTSAAAVVGAAVLAGLLPAPAAAAGAEPDGYAAIRWHPCAGAPEVDCGTLAVPIDWSRPRGGKIELALARRKASDPAARIGSLLIGRGGPGGSGVELIRTNPRLLSADLHRHYDVVGFDPRGVGDSHPVLCSGPEPRLADVTTPADFAALRAVNRAHAENCRRHTGKLFDFVDTVSVARDIDAIRAGFGERKLNFLGFSYGTLMGQQYAELFPRRVGRFVLDSNMDHSRNTTGGFLRSQSTAAEETFDEYVRWCDRTPGCALYGTDVRTLHHELYARAQRGELVLPRPGGPPVAYTAMEYLSEVFSAGYGPTWYELAQFMVELRDARPDPGAASSAVRRPAAPETYRDPFAAVFCQDWSTPLRDFAELQRHRRALERVAPDMKLSPLAWLATLSCVGLADRVRNPQHRLRINDADPFLFVNSRFDPATGYDWGVAAARQARQTLLTYDGWGHFAYPLSPCVAEKVERYLRTGELPARDTHCPAVPPTPPGPQTRGPHPERLPPPVGPRPDVRGYGS